MDVEYLKGGMRSEQGFNKKRACSPGLSFESSKAEFPTVNEMADRLGVDIRIYPTCFESGQEFPYADDMANSEQEWKVLKFMFLKF